MYPSPPYISQVLSPLTRSRLVKHSSVYSQEPMGIGTVPPSTGLRTHHPSKLLFVLTGDPKLLEIHFLSLPSWFLLIILILLGLHFYYKLSQIIFYHSQPIKQQKWYYLSYLGLVVLEKLFHIGCGG